MPIMDGLESTIRIKEYLRERNKTVAIAALTAYTSEEYK